jgi:hypothetical protein
MPRKSDRELFQVYKQELVACDIVYMWTVILFLRSAGLEHLLKDHYEKGWYGRRAKMRNVDGVSRVRIYVCMCAGACGVCEWPP